MMELYELSKESNEILGKLAGILCGDEVPSQDVLLAWLLVLGLDLNEIEMQNELLKNEHLRNPLNCLIKENQ